MQLLCSYELKEMQHYISFGPLHFFEGVQARRPTISKPRLCPTKKQMLIYNVVEHELKILTIITIHNTQAIHFMVENNFSTEKNFIFFRNSKCKFN